MEENNTQSVHWSFWVIGVVTLLYNGAGVLNFIMQMNDDNVAAMPDVYRMIIEGRPLWATGAFFIAVFGGALGCLLLLLKKSVAYYMFIASLVGAFITMIHTLSVVGLNSGPLGFAIGNLVQLAVTVFLIWYAKWTERRGWIN